MRFVDCHAHLDDLQFENDREKVIKRAKRAGVDIIVESGTNIASSGLAVEIADFYDDVYATVGIHPIDGINDVAIDNWDQKLVALAGKSKVVAIGECGLDYYRQPQTKKQQQKLLIAQLELATALDMPVVIHCRKAFEDLFSILKSYRQIRGMFHSWTGSYKEAKSAVDFNFLFSFNAIITYPNAKEVVEVCRALPIWRTVIETDSPYLAPQTIRGKRNEPSNVYFVAEKIAQVKNIKLEDIATATTQNAIRMFAFP